MTDERRMEPVPGLLELIADHLEEWLSGDELALETLGEAITRRGFTPDHLRAAIFTLKSMGGTAARTDAVLGSRWSEPFEWEAVDGEATH